MPTPKQIERAKKIINEQKLRNDLLNKYNIKIPDTLNRAATYFLDMSGTPEADRKNIEFLHSLNTADGQQKMLARAYDAISSMDLKAYLSNDIDKILDVEEANPYLSQLAFAINSVASTVSPQLRPIGALKNTLKGFLPTWELCGIHISRMKLIANDVDINDPLNGATLDDMSSRVEDFKDLMPLFNEITGVLLHKEESAEYAKTLDTLAKMGVSGSDIYYTDYFDEKENPITFEAALQGIQGGEKITAVPMTDEKKEERKQQIKHMEPFGVRTGAGSRTPLSLVPGVSGLGISTRTTRTIDDYNAQSGFYGGLEVSEAVKKELEGQNVSAILDFEPGKNGTYRVSYKFPERGSCEPHASMHVVGNSEKVFSGGEFNIRRNVNSITKIVASKLFDENGMLIYGPNTEKLYNAREIMIRTQMTSSTVEQLHNGINHFLDALEISAGAEREELFSFFKASYSNSGTAIQVIDACLSDLKKAANYSNISARRNLQELDDAQGEPIYRAHDDYINTVNSLRRMKDMDIDAQTAFPCNMNSNGSVVIYSAAINAYNNLHPDKAIKTENLQIKVSDYCNKHPKPVVDDVKPEAIYDVASAMCINDVSIGGKNITLSFENVDRASNELIFNAGSFAAIGVYESPQELKNTLYNDAYGSESTILTVTTLTDGAEYTSESSYDPEEDGIVVVNEISAVQTFAAAENSINTGINAESFIGLAERIENGFEAHRQARENEIEQLNRANDICNIEIANYRKKIETETAQLEKDTHDYEANKKLLTDTQAEYDRTLAEWDKAKEKMTGVTKQMPGADEIFAEFDRTEKAFRDIESRRSTADIAVKNVENGIGERSIMLLNSQIKAQEMRIANNNAALKNRVRPITEMPSYISDFVELVGSLDNKDIASFESLSELRDTAKNCLKHVGPSLGGKNTSKFDTFELDCYNCAKLAYQFACGKLNEQVRDYIADNKHAAFSFVRFYSCGTKERDAYLAKPDVAKAVGNMKTVVERADMFISGAESDNRKTELQCKAGLFKTILDGMEYLKNKKAFTASHPGVKGNELLAKADLASKFCNAYAQIKRFMGTDELPTFKTNDNRDLSLKEATEYYLSGQSVIAFNAHNKRFGAEIAPDGTIAPKVSPDIPKTSIEDCTSMLTHLNRSLGETDNIAVWTNSKAFKDIRTVLTDMTDPKKHWTRAEKLNALPWIEDFCEKYLKKKQDELKEKGSLDNRSRSRVNIVKCIKAVASNFKVPEAELEKAKAAEKKPNEKAPEQPMLK